MAVYIPVECPKCKDKESIVKFGQTSNGKQRFLCQNKECDRNTFIINHEKMGWLQETKEKIIIHFYSTNLSKKLNNYASMKLL